MHNNKNNVLMDNIDLKRFFLINLSYFHIISIYLESENVSTGINIVYIFI